MRILLVRHGQSEGNANPLTYLEKGDQVDLTSLGWRQGIAGGEFLENRYIQTGTTKWPTIYVSSLPRPKQTASAILVSLRKIFPGKPKLYEDPRLIEKFFGAASHLYHLHETLSPEERKIREVILELSKVTYAKDQFTAANLFGDSTKNVYVSVKSFIDGTFARDCKEGKDDFLIISHGAVMQAFLMAWAHIPVSAKGALGNPNNCDVIEIIGEPKNWKITKIYDGEEMKPVEIDILKDIRPFSFEDLPPVPPEYLPELKI